MALHGTHNPLLCNTMDGRSFVGYGNDVTRMCRVSGTKLTNEYTIDANESGRPSMYKPDVWTYVRDIGQRLEFSLLELENGQAPRVVGAVAPGVPFYARHGHYITNQPKITTVTRDEGLQSKIVLKNAVLGRIDHEDLYFVDAITRNEVKRWRGGAVTTVGKAPDTWVQGIGIFDVLKGKWVIGPSGGGKLLDDQGRDCKVTPWQNEGSLVLFEHDGAVWMATAYQPKNMPDYWVALRPVADNRCIVLQRNGAYLDVNQAPNHDFQVITGPPTGDGLLLDRFYDAERIIPTIAHPGPSQLNPVPIPIPPNGGNVAFENMYDELIALSKTSPNWAKALSVAPTSPERIAAAQAFVNEAAFTFNADDNITAGDPGSYGMLWRASKGSVSDDCLAIIGSDGKLYENDIIIDVDGPNIKIVWPTPKLSQWSYQAPTDPGTTGGGTTPVPPNPIEPNPEPEPEPMPTGPFAPYSVIPHDVPDNPEHGWEFWLGKYFAGSDGYPSVADEAYRSFAFDAWRRSMQMQVTKRGQYPDGGWNTPGSSEDWMKMADQAGADMHKELNSRP